MKSQRRHELQENALQTELSKLGEFLRRRGTAVAWGVLGVALIVFLIVYVQGRSQRRKQELLAQYALAERALGDPDVEIEEAIRRLETLAGQEDEPRVAAMSALHLGGVYARQAHFGADELTGAEQEELLNQARTWYRRAIEEYPDQDLAAAQGRFGLAKLAESRRDFTAARELYEAIVATPGLSGQLVVLEAQRVLERLDRMSEPVRLATTLPAQAQPAAQAEPAFPTAETMPDTQPGAATHPGD